MNENLDLERICTPTEVAELFFFSDEVLTSIRSFSIQYATRKLDFNFDVSVDDLKVFFSIILLSGYVKCRSRRMYWESARDTHNQAVSDAMTRNRFEEIMKYIYFYDPNDIEQGDKCAKVRPMMEMINKLFLKYKPSEKLADVDEAMVPYYGKYGGSIKQAMRQKPVRFGYKVWCLNYPNGYLVAFDVYQGSRGKSNKHKEEFGVLCLLAQLPDNTKLHLFLDYFFTSPVLFEELSRRGILVTGTFLQDRLGDCPLPGVKKESRGKMVSYHTKDAGEMIFVRWKDNEDITIGSNCIGTSPIAEVKRWSTQEKKKIDIEAPGSVILYNKGMGGTVVHDHAFSCNRPGIRSKKWWFPLAVFLLQSSMHNAYHIYRGTPNGGNIPFLHFIRPIVQTYLTSFGKSSKVRPGQMLYGNKEV